MASNFVVQISEIVVQEKLSSVIITGSADVTISTKYVLKADVGKRNEGQYYRSVNDLCLWQMCSYMLHVVNYTKN